jgi:hypothetical protein
LHKITAWLPPISPISTHLAILILSLDAALGEECSNVLGLLYQLQLPNLSPDQKSDVLAELLAASIHLHSHCDEDFQGAIAQELEK